MPYYDMMKNYKQTKIKLIINELQKGWTEIIKYIKFLDPYKNIITTHPSIDYGSYSARKSIKDDSFLDFDMLQTGHFDRNCLNITLEVLIKSLNKKPYKPVINGEVCYEGICGSNWQDIQRFLFWTNVISGAAGYTYGADGLWCFTDKEEYHGISAGWGSSKWKQSYKFPGAYQLGLGKKFLERYEWQKFEAHPEWVEPHWNEQDRILPYACGIPRKVRLIYFPGVCFLNPYKNSDLKSISYASKLKKIKILNIEKDIKYHAFYFNPRNGKELKIMQVTPNEYGEWIITDHLMSINPTLEDWVMVIEKEKK